MATERNYERRSGGGVMNAIIGLVCLVILAGVGYAQWPLIKEAYYSAAPQPAQADTSELDKVKAQLEKVEAQLRAAQAAKVAPPVIVQHVPQGQAPAPEPVVNVPPAPAPVQGEVAPPPAPAPIVIVHQVSGSHQTITGSGACAVAAKGARRCGK